MDHVLYPNYERIRVSAYYVGERIDVKDLSRAEFLFPAPTIQPVGSRGHAVVFRYGALVLFEVEAGEREQLLTTVAPYVSGAAVTPEGEDALILITPEAEETVRRKSASRLLDPSGIILRSATRGRLQIVAEVLAKSVALSHYDRGVGAVFDRIEPFAASMQNGHPHRGREHELLRLLGAAAVTQHQTVGRVEIREKPDLAWDRSDLDRLYQQLSAEYALRERDAALTRKLDLISSTTSTFFNLQHSRRTLRVEWYIVILILVEIVLFLYDIFGRG